MTIITYENLKGEFIKQIEATDNWFSVILTESRMRGSSIRWLNESKNMYETVWHDKNRKITVSKI